MAIETARDWENADHVWSPTMSLGARAQSVESDIDDYLTGLTADVRTALLGASVRGDRDALTVAIRNAAAVCEISEEQALAAWVRALLGDAPDQATESAIAIADLERLPWDYLIGLCHQLARAVYVAHPPGHA